MGDEGARGEGARGDRGRGSGRERSTSIESSIDAAMAAPDCWPVYWTTTELGEAIAASIATPDARLSSCPCGTNCVARARKIH